MPMAQANTLRVFVIVVIAVAAVTVELLGKTDPVQASRNPVINTPNLTMLHIQSDKINQSENRGHFLHFSMK
jgi:hypothetical protein